MDKALFEGITNGFEEAIAHAEGTANHALRVHTPDDIDVKRIRASVNMTQKAFAETFGFSLSGLCKWESGTRKPEKTARTLLQMIEREPETVLRLTQ